MCSRIRQPLMAATHIEIILLGLTRCMRKKHLHASDNLINLTLTTLLFFCNHSTIELSKGNIMNYMFIYYIIAYDDI